MNRARSRRTAAAALTVALLAAALAPGAGAAPAPGIGKATALGQPGAVSSSKGAAMSLEFTRRTASVAGPGALIGVRCAGTSAAACVGTLAIEAPGEEPPVVAFSVDRGEERVVVVPLGAQRSMFDGIVAVRTRVVAETVQAEGGSVRTARALRFK